MTVINTNTASINAQYNLNKVNKEMESAMEALSSGKRINSAADDAAGLSIITRMESQVRGLSQAIENAQDAQNLADTAEGAMDEISNMLQRVRELSVQASNGAMNQQDRDALQNEVDQLVSEIDRVSTDTKFNNQRLLDGSFDAAFQIGMEAGQTIELGITSMSSSVLGREGNVAGATTQITSGSAEGTAATVTKATMAFNGVDTYSFKVNGTSVAGTVDPSNNSSLGALVNDINNNLKNAGDNDVVASVSASGVVEFQNTAGDKISITDFASSGNGTASFTPQVGSGSAKLLDDAGAVSTVSAVGKQSGTFGVTLNLEANGAYTFKVNDKEINVASTDSTSDIANKIETALGGNYVALISTDTAAGGTPDAGTLAYRAAYDAENSTTTTAATMATMYGVSTDEIVIYNTNTASTSEINITDFSVTDGKSNGTRGVIDVASPTAEAQLVDGTMYFQTDANTTTDIAEIDLSFSSTSSDYVVALDGQEFRIQAEKLKDGTAAADLITKINANSTMNGGRAAAAGLGSLGNEFSTGTPTAATLTSSTLDFAGDETGATFDLSIDGNNTKKSVTLAGGDMTTQAQVVSALQSAVDTAFGENVVKVAASGAAQVSFTTVQKGDGYKVQISGADSVSANLLNGTTTGVTASGSTATGGINGLGNYNYEIVQNGTNISIKKLTDLAQSSSSTTTMKAEIVAKSAATAATAATGGEELTFASGALDLFETGDAVKSSTLSGIGLANDTTYYIRKTDPTNDLTASFHLTAEDANDGINAVDLTGSPTTAMSIQMVNGAQANPGNNASDANWYLNAGTTTNKTKDTGTLIDLNTNTNALHTSGSAESSEMTLEFQGNDTFNMTIEGQAITAAVAGGSVATMIATINADANLQAAGVSAEAITGNSDAILLKRADGQSLDITGFSATNNTEVLASPGSQQGVVKTLTSKAAVTAGDVSAAGLAVATQATLSFDGQDEVSFKLDDGNQVSTIRFTDTHAGGTTGANLQAELDTALAGTDISATVVVSGNGVSVELLNSTGGKIDLTNFATKGSGTATMRPDTLQGNAVILNDDSAVSLSGKSISEIEFDSQGGATEALEIIDRALQTINDSRAELGAVSNRLDHTISNLGNVIVNTEASQSRIEDADFAKVTGELTKAQIMSQAATAMLAQANASKQGVLSLLQG